jgi:DNA-binding response OmpR family regulator
LTPWRFAGGISDLMAVCSRRTVSCAGVAAHPPVNAMNVLSLSAPAPGVLVVDDEKCIRDVLQLAFELEGFRVLAVEGGAEAVALLESGTEAVDVALVDRHMAGMSGEETVTSLRRLCPDLPILLVAGEPPLGGLPAGCTDFILKPFGLRGLVARIRALIERSERARAAHQSGLSLGAGGADANPWEVG